MSVDTMADTNMIIVVPDATLDTIIALQGTKAKGLAVPRVLVHDASRLYDVVVPLDSMDVTRAVSYLRTRGFEVRTVTDHKHDFLWTRSLYMSLGLPFTMYDTYSATNQRSQTLAYGLEIPGATRVDGHPLDMIDILRDAAVVHAPDGPVALLADMLHVPTIIVHAYLTNPEVIPVYRHARVLRSAPTVNNTHT